MSTGKSANSIWGSWGLTGRKRNTRTTLGRMRQGAMGSSLVAAASLGFPTHEAGVKSALPLELLVRVT